MKITPDLLAFQTSFGDQNELAGSPKNVWMNPDFRVYHSSLRISSPKKWNKKLW